MGSGGRGGTALLRFSVFPHFARQPPKDPNALYLAVNKPSEREERGAPRLSLIIVTKEARHE